LPTPLNAVYGFETGNIADKFVGKRLIIVGGSHAGRLADSLDDMKIEVVDLSVPGWSATDRNVDRATDQLTKVLNEKTDVESIVIYQIFDNSVFLGVSTLSS
jgi:hypothetical protein